MPRSTARAAWKRELAATLALGLPLVLTNLAQMAMTVTDVIFIGRLGSQALAASALGANLFTAIEFFGLGLVAATAPMVAHALGRRGNTVRDVRRTVRQGLWTAVIYSVPGCLLLWHGEAILLAIDQPPELAAQAGAYLRALMWAMPPFLGFLVLRSFVAALQRPRSAFLIALAAIVLNVFGNWVLVFGNLGAPALGLVGAGLASALATLGLFLGMAGVVCLDRRFRRYHLFGDVWQPDWQRLAEFWKLGLPIGAATAFEVTIFNAAAFLMGWLGEPELAAHAIAIQIASVTFMIPYGIAQAATVRVGHAYGARQPDQVARAGWCAFSLGIGSMAIAAALMLLAPDLLVSAFLDIGDPANAQVLRLATAYLAVAALFQIVDGAQVLGAGMLRGLHDTRVPMLYAALGYWGVGLPSGAALAFWAGWRGVGVWSGLAIGLALVAVLMMQRWLRRDRVGLLRRA
ncbi:MATE family efflux transporter [Bordetella bronchiseptica]|uniref:MATE family efflux transporter n=1 Tax=Bordetella bronchiseptica TaxID=518 RepID=UPI000461D438|nr:MATE family efflux transporter [Bordetella bronchiseptica]KDC45957.1 putative multidrug efflux protein NorM [Bordetella bronchiseptica M85/00/2]